MYKLKLKEIREKKGLSQKDIGKIIGVSNQAVSNYENEIRKLSAEQVAILSEALEVSADYFLGLIDKDKGKSK